MKTELKLKLFAITLMFLSCIDTNNKEKDEVKPSLEANSSFTVEKSKNTSLISHTDLTSTLIIDQQERWQLISSSQNYDGSYAVFARFITKPSDRVNFKKIIGVELKLMNYKGLVYVGIEDACFFEMNNGMGALVYLKAFGKYQGIDENPCNELRMFNSGKTDILPIYGLDIEVENGSMLWATKMLKPMHVISKSEFDEINDPSLKLEIPYTNCNFNNTNVYAKCSDGRTFDTEFFYRDGIYTIPKPNPESFIINKDSLDLKLITSPDTRCRDSKLKIHFNTL